MVFFVMREGVSEVGDWDGVKAKRLCKRCLGLPQRERLRGPLGYTLTRMPKL